MKGMKSEARRAWTELAKRVGQIQSFIPSGPPITRPTHSATDAMRMLAGTPVGRLGNRATLLDGIRFPSKLQADRYRELKLLRQSGQVLYFLREVPFDVATGVVYRADFVIVWNRSGSPQEIVTVEDTKGHLTDTSRIKIAAVQDRYGITVRLLRRADVSR